MERVNLCTECAGVFTTDAEGSGVGTIVKCPHCGQEEAHTEQSLKKGIERLNSAIASSRQILRNTSPIEFEIVKSKGVEV